MRAAIVFMKNLQLGLNILFETLLFIFYTSTSEI